MNIGNPEHLQCFKLFTAFREISRNDVVTSEYSCYSKELIGEIIEEAKSASNEWLPLRAII